MSDDTTQSKPAKARKPAPKDRSVLVHVGILAVAAVTAFSLWTRDKQSSLAATGDVTVWSGRPADVKRITFEAKGKKVVLESKRDDRGDYLVGTAEREATPPKPKGDAGAPEAKPAEKTTTQLLSVGEAQKLLEMLAPLKALRDLGKVEGDKAKDYGLDAPDGTLTVDIGGTEHKLQIGGTTPGSGDRYVKDPATNEAFAIKGDILNDLEHADNRLLERDLHEWKDNDVQTAVLTAGGKSRDVVRASSADNKRFWADKSAPATNDETFGNWMTKLAKLRPQSYVTADPPKLEPVFKLTFAAGRPIGFVELGKVPGEGQHAEYYLRSERTRLWAKLGPDAEAVETDLAGVMK